MSDIFTTAEGRAIRFDKITRVDRHVEDIKLGGGKGVVVQTAMVYMRGGDCIYIGPNELPDFYEWLEARNPAFVVEGLNDRPVKP